MIDIQILRAYPDIVKSTCKNKGLQVDLDLLLDLDRKQTRLKRELEDMRALRNSLSAMPYKGKPDPATISDARRVREDLSKLDAEYEAAKTQFQKLLKEVPNIPTDDTPIGASEDDNVVVYTWSEPRLFDFVPKNHQEIASHHGWIDKERASKVAGSRFAYIKGDLVKLQIAIVAWTISKLTDEKFIADIIEEAGLSVASTPFVPVLPPYMIRTSLYDAMDRLEPSDDRYKIHGTNLWLQGSAEHVLGSMHADEVFDEKEMPVRYLGYATSFRKEAGTAGKDMEGIIRLHQFDKLEMESFSTKETSHDEHILLSVIQERLMQILEIPYRKIQKCTFDIGKPNAKGSDIEAWLPGQGKYRETHTADYMTDYQSRRLCTRVRRQDKTLELVHTNDATAFALGRIMVAIIENFQNEDHSVMIPKALLPFMGFVERIG